MGPRSDRVYVAALAVLGAAATALSFALEPTPDRYKTTPDGLRVRIDAAMHAVDYLILALRVGGVVTFVAGAYLTYRRFRPDAINDRYEDMEPECGNPGIRSGIGWRSALGRPLLRALALLVVGAVAHALTPDHPGARLRGLH